MKKSRQFDNILDECLGRLLAKGETIEQCLASYPEQAAELKPLLEVALATKQASAIQPHPEFRARARYQFRSALQAMEAKKRLPFFGWLPGWATAVAIVLVLLLAGGGTVVAAGNSMPDEPLYLVKIASEQVRLILTPSALGKAELYANLADKRVVEIVYVANKGDARRVEAVAQRLNNYLTRIASLVATQREATGVLTAPVPRLAPSEAPVVPEQAGEPRDEGITIDRRAKLRMVLARYAINHPAALRAVLKEAPEPARFALRRAIDISEARYQQALEAVANRGED